MHSVILATDSACDVPYSILEENEIYVLPFHITLGAEDFTDGITITRDALYERVEETGLLPHTSAIPPAAYTDFFTSLLKKGEAVIFLSLGACFSSAYQNASLAASEFENVFVIDTGSLSSGDRLFKTPGLLLQQTGFL